MNKDGRRGRRESQRRLERKGTQEADESELMTIWTSPLARPNTQWTRRGSQRNYIVDTVNVDDTTAYTTRNESDYKKKESTVYGENQECESLECGYAPKYLVKQVDQEQEVLRKFLRKVESLFHDVVHELVKLIVCTGTPIGLVTWIVLLRFSHLFFVTVQKRRNKVRNRRAKAGTRRNYRALLLIDLLYSNFETAQGMEEALKQLVASRSEPANTARHTDTSRGDQGHSSVRISK